jgi:hypothetical protein
LGERGPYKAEVTGSIPVPPTTEILRRSSRLAPLASLVTRRRKPFSIAK